MQTGAVATAAASPQTNLLLHALLLLDTPSITSSSRVSLSRIYSCNRHQLESSGRPWLSMACSAARMRAVNTSDSSSSVC
jgi:hypothetical protein